jgi:hypothetical protein
MDVLTGILQFLGRDIAKLARPILRLPVAADMIAAGIAFPEWQIGQIGSVRIDLDTISKTGLDFSLALAEI